MAVECVARANNTFCARVGRLNVPEGPPDVGSLGHKRVDGLCCERVFWSRRAGRGSEEAVNRGFRCIFDIYSTVYVYYFFFWMID